MLIESIIQRDGGTPIVMKDAIYDFKPDSHGRHVCEVNNPEHAKRLLSITEGFREVPVEKKRGRHEPAAT